MVPAESVIGVIFHLVLYGTPLAMAVEDLAAARAGEGIPVGIVDWIGNTRLMLAASPKGTSLDRTNWAVVCDSFQTGSECAKAIDGDTNTIWHTEYTPTTAPLPHTITIDMLATQNVSGVAMLPRQDGQSSGFISQHQIFLSADGTDFGSPVAFGTWFADRSEKTAIFEPKPARFVRIVALTEATGRAWTSVAEINVYTASYTAPPPGSGEWGPTINFPIVPVAASLQPSGKVVVWSAYSKDAFAKGPGNVTLTATFDPATGVVSQRTVSNTGHDMFCPGISIDANGRTVVTGGNNAPKTSIYDPSTDGWVSAPNMVIPRGYQSSATCSDGRVFTIGGSWSGGRGNKTGEVYDPTTNAWTLLPQCDVRPMLTADVAGVYRADNHAWLFGWKAGSVFQAGPSKAMNWYTTTGSGGHVAAGLRGLDSDSMNGVAVMFDAGKILTAGGSINYAKSVSTTNGHIITIDAVNKTATVVRTGSNMTFNRIFHNAVVLPTGETFVTGGQQIGDPFVDSTPQLTPEIYSPSKDRFSSMAPNSIPRTYHSIALLLPDGTVLSGGGGLCGSCDTNHFDAQIYTPPYLFTPSGGRATRPRILNVSASTVKAGDKLEFGTDKEVTSASIIRLGSATHSVDTDQRRIALTLTVVGANVYSVIMPADYGVLLPGYWMLFVMDSSGVPSVATMVKVTLS